MSGSAEPADSARVRSALTALTAISPYFEADVPQAAPVSITGGGDEAGAGGSSAGGTAGADKTAGADRTADADGTAPVSVSELHLGGAALAAAIDGVNARLGGVERRVAASALALGHAARLWSVALGTWATSGIVPDLDPSALRVQPRLTAPLRLIVDRPTGWWPTPPSPPDSADGADGADGAVAAAGSLLREVVVERNLRPYFAAVQAQTRLPPGLLWGNAASALVGATRMLSGFLAAPPAPNSTSTSTSASASNTSIAQQR